MARAAADATTLDALLSLSATKKYPTARLQRGILFAMTEIADEDLRADPAYARLLAANATGCEFLGACRKRGGLPIVTRRPDLPDTEGARRQAEIESRAFALYALCLPKAISVGEQWKCCAHISKTSHLP